MDKSDQNEELMIMTVDLGEGSQDTIHVSTQDSAHDLAFRFCLKHKLDIELVEALTQTIKENIEQVKTESELDTVIEQVSQKSPVAENYEATKENIDQNFTYEEYESNQEKNYRVMKNILKKNDLEEELQADQIEMQPAWEDNLIMKSYQDYQQSLDTQYMKIQSTESPKRQIKQQIRKKSKNLLNRSMPSIPQKNVKRQHRQSIHDRLFQNSKLYWSKKRSRTPNIKRKKKLKKGKQNCCSRLYYHGIKRKEEIKRDQRLEKLEKRQRDEENNDFRPKINEISRILAVRNNVSFKISKGEEFYWRIIDFTF